MDYVASNASVHTHAPFPLVGDYAPNPTEHRTHSVALRVLRILLKGTLKRRPLCRDVTNRYTLMRWQYTIPSGDISFAKRGFPKWKPLTRDDSYGDYPSKRVFKYRTPLHRKGTVKQGHPWFRLVRRKTRRTEHERVGKTPIHLRCEKYPHGTKHSSSLLRQKGTPRNRASLCILSLNFTSLLTFIRILLFPCFQFLSPFFAGV